MGRMRNPSKIRLYAEFGRFLTDGIKKLATFKPIGDMQRDLAEELGITEWTIYGWRQGERLPQEKEIIAFFARKFVCGWHANQTWIDAFLKKAQYPLNAQRALHIELFNKLPTKPSPKPYNQNPFITGGRINNPRNFFGRKEILADLQANLIAGNNLSVWGECEIGKSSFLYYLYKTSAQWLPADITLEYIDLQEVWDTEDLFCEILNRLGVLTGPNDDCHPKTLRDALKERPMILLFDEAEQLANPSFDPRILKMLRALAQSPTFTLVVATQHSLDQIFIENDPTSPFYNIFIEQILGPLTPLEAKALVYNRLAKTNVTFTNNEIEELIITSGCHPAKLQNLARALFETKQPEDD